MACLRERPQSQSIHKKSLERMPGGVSSPVRSFLGVGIDPMVVERGKGDTIWDVDGNAYIDYCLSFGPLILGHAREEVVQAAFQQMQKGSSFGIATASEWELAEKIHRHMPHLEKIRFVSSGTEATMSAIRLARGYTGKNTLVKFSGHYHGHSDGLLIQAGSGVFGLPTATSRGIPDSVIQHTVSLPFNDIETCRSYIRTHPDLAAVILEPIAGNMGVVPAEKPFIEMLREETQKIGALLIFDEVITGFRVGLQGAAHLYQVTPDLTCLGKVIGGGYPVAAFGGKEEIMDLIAPLGGVYQAGTLSGNPVAMRAGLKTLSLLEKEGFYEDLENKVALLTQPIQEFLKKRDLPAVLNRAGSMFTLFFGIKQAKNREDLNSLDEGLFRAFFRHLFENGIYIPPAAHEASFISSAHTQEHLLHTRDIIFSFLHKM
ncbi:MAG: glutamate-1-semialdehyde 2,1-aminomutase [Chlamydiales bacterium]|nr:glutamate-1-semialdehyde 2,1-aminomutase [Chlamydiales bacterium]